MGNPMTKSEKRRVGSGSFCKTGLSQSNAFIRPRSSLAFTPFVPVLPLLHMVLLLSVGGNLLVAPSQGRARGLSWKRKCAITFSSQQRDKTTTRKWGCPHFFIPKTRQDFNKTYCFSFDTPTTSHKGRRGLNKIFSKKKIPTHF